MESVPERKETPQAAAERLFSHYVSPEEYARRREEFSDPHIEVIAEGEKKLALFGANHTNDPADPQFQQIADMIEGQAPQRVLVEGMRRLDHPGGREQFLAEVREMSREDAMAHGESFYTTWEAIQRGHRVDCPEPSRQELNAHLLDEGLSREAVFVEQMLTHVVQWDNHGRPDDLEVYLRRWHEELCRDLGMQRGASAFGQMVDVARELGIDLEVDNLFEDDTLPELQDPIPWEGKEMTEVNMVAQKSSEFRDRRILRSVYEHLSKNNDSLMIVYGASHIHMLSPAFRELVAELGARPDGT